MRLRTSDAPDGEGGNKWQRTGINDGLLTPIAWAAEADPVSSPEGWGCFLSDHGCASAFSKGLTRVPAMDRTPSQTNVMEVGDQSALDFFDAVLSRLSRLPARERASAVRSLYRI
jgi:hypothetical protein